MSVIFASRPRLGGTINEDHCGAADGIAWVLDGAGVPPSLSRCCDRGASWYVNRLAAALVSASTADPGLALPRILASAISRVAAEHRATCDSSPPGAITPSAAVALAQQRDGNLDLLVLGDAAVLLDTGSEVRCVSDQRLSRAGADIRARFRRALSAGAGFDDPMQQKLLARIVRLEQTARNCPGGYWIAAEEPRAAPHAIHERHPVGDEPGHLRRIALLSDGVARAAEEFLLYESWASLLKALVAHGPAACIQGIRDAEAADPSGSRWPRSKYSDDATALLWEL